MIALILKWIRIFLPTPCVECGELQARLACNQCVRQLPRMDQSVDCIGIDHVYTYFRYQGLVKALIHRCKFGPSLEAANEISRLVSGQSPVVNFGDYRMVVAVPGSRNRILDRGFSLPDLVFRRLTHLAPVLVRKKETRPLFELTPPQRESELADAFGLVDYCIDSGDSVLIVDDILTTGATARAIADLCRNAGAARVDLLVVAAVESESS